MNVRKQVPTTNETVEKRTAWQEKKKLYEKNKIKKNVKKKGNK